MAKAPCPAPAGCKPVPSDAPPPPPFLSAFTLDRRMSCGPVEQAPVEPAPGPDAPDAPAARTDPPDAWEYASATITRPFDRRDVDALAPSGFEFVDVAPTTRTRDGTPALLCRYRRPAP